MCDHRNRVMVQKGQKYRRAGGADNWEVLGPRQNPGCEGEWFLSKVDGGIVVTVHEQDLESGTMWAFVPDDA